MTLSSSYLENPLKGVLRQRWTREFPVMIEMFPVLPNRAATSHIWAIKHLKCD